MPSSSRLLFWLGLVMTVTVAAILSIGTLGRTRPPAPAAPEQPLRVGYAIQPPHAFRDESGRLQGEAIVLMRTVMHQLGRPEPIWVHADVAALIHELEMGRIDAIAAGLSITPQRARRVDFSRPSAAVSPGLLVAAGNPLELHSLSDLMSAGPARLGVLDPSAELDLAVESGLPESRLLRLGDSDLGLAALQQGRVQALLLPLPALRWTIARARSTPTAQPSGAPEPAEPFWMPADLAARARSLPALAFRRGDPLRDTVDAVLARHIGSPDHRSQVRPYGFEAPQIDPVQGERWPTPQDGTGPADARAPIP
ncbi:MAG: polar amino acid transport system substrate-binding protein [Pseudomonadota bacterium]|nr:polar amino acid transport system substrate-binding protein [Pseudomonadota bacterium]